MQIITNQARIVRGARLGKIGVFAGLGFLLAGLIVSLTLKQGQFVWISFVCLILGFVVSTVGTMNMNRWVREPRADQALAQALKGFDDRYRLYNYILPAPHVLLSPAGLFVLTAMGQDGTVRNEGDKFRRNFSLGRIFRFMADEGVGHPFVEGDAQVQALRQYLESHDAGEGVDIQNILVFYHPRVQLVVSEPPRPVIEPKGLKKVVRKQREDKLSGSQYRKLQELFERKAG
jgi:Nuclease-related domain